MGMFDLLRCEYPLPDPRFQNEEFQTKDTPVQFLDEYRITGDGFLEHCDYDLVSVPPEERPYYDRYLETGKLELLVLGCIKKVNERWTRQRYVGDLSFCAIVGEDLPRDQQTFVEFVATFDGEGKLMNVVKRQEKRLSEMRLPHEGQQWR